MENWKKVALLGVAFITNKYIRGAVKNYLADFVRPLNGQSFFQKTLSGKGGCPPPCFRIGGAEDNFIFYIEYCFFFVLVMNLR